MGQTEAQGRCNLCDGQVIQRLVQPACIGARPVWGFFCRRCDVAGPTRR